jgi:hypothetical protein
VIFCFMVLVGGGGGISYVPQKGIFVIITRWGVGTDHTCMKSNDGAIDSLQIQELDLAVVDRK